jgi:hypothetical protein
MRFDGVKHFKQFISGTMLLIAPQTPHWKI